jgi:hypothetical protein
MKKSLCLIIMLTLLIQLVELTELRAEPDLNLGEVQEETSLEVLFNRILIYLKEGGRLSGLLVGIEGNTLIVRIGTKDERIQLDSLGKIIIQKDKKKGFYALSGMLLGIYAANMAFHRARNQAAFFMENIESDSSYLLMNALYAAAGGGLGILISSTFEKGEKVFEFTGDVEKRNREWEQLRRFVIEGNYAPKKTHIKVQAGKVFTRVSDRYRNLLIDNDYSVWGGGWMDNESWEEAKDINLMRKVQLTYSPNTFLELGIASVWIGEPSFEGNKWGNYESSYVWQKHSATGIYAVGIFKPFHRVMPEIISWELGIGAGAAIVNYSLKSLTTTYNPLAEIADEYSISKTLFSGIAFTELSLYLYDSMSLGLIADYTYVPEQHAPAMSVAGLPAQKLRFGNSCIGFSLGFHF